MNWCRFFVLFMVATGVLLVESGQAEARSVDNGDMLVGLRVPVGGVAGASFGIGAGLEKMITPKVGITGAAYYAGYSESLAGVGMGSIEYSYTNILLTAGGSYHFYTTDKLDLSAGVSLGYNVASVSVSGGGSASGVSAGGFIWSGMAQGRYFFTPKISGYLGLGYGLGYATIGLDFKL